MAIISIEGVVNYVQDEPLSGDSKFQVVEQLEGEYGQCYNVYSTQRLGICVGDRVCISGVLVWACERTYGKNTVGHIHLRSIQDSKGGLIDDAGFCSSARLKTEDDSPEITGNYVVEVGSSSEAVESDSGVEEVQVPSENLGSNDRLRNASVGNFSQYLMKRDSSSGDANVEAASPVVNSKWSGKAEEAEVTSVAAETDKQTEVTSSNDAVIIKSDGHSDELADAKKETSSVSNDAESGSKSMKSGSVVKIARPRSVSTAFESGRGFDVPTSAEDIDEAMSDEEEFRRQYQNAVGSDDQSQSNINLQGGW
ncbi:hypothetical protein [Vibrio owensii]|uniref:hypothetical protein n=1 Tax=Vibrio owensii TaxID=696485 RepID=UPI0018F137D3|nr:hypothetical protein [Vibrio owensii]